MKHWSRRVAYGTALVLACTTLPQLEAQAQGPGRLRSLAGSSLGVKSTGFAVTGPVRNLKVAGPASADQSAVKGETSIPKQLRMVNNFTVPRAYRPGTTLDLAVQRAASLASAQGLRPTPAPAPSLVFDGISNQDNFNVFGFRVVPPDTNGDVGPNHYVQTVNLLVKVFDKRGNSLAPAFPMSSLFAPLGANSPCALLDDGDPIVLYDQLADRWLLSQFALPFFPVAPFFQCIAISQTRDPTGGYFIYEFLMPNNKLNDYPHFGVWPDAYYMTDNQFLFNPPGGFFQFAGGGAFAFDRKGLLAGDPNASGIYFDLQGLDPTIGGMLPSDHDGLRPPPRGRPNVFSYFVADEFGDAIDGLRLFDFHADFDNPASSTFIERPESPLAVAAFDPVAPVLSGRRHIEQPDPLTPPLASCTPVPECFFLDSTFDRIMHRLQYRNFGDYETLVVNHTVNVGQAPSVPPIPTIDEYQAGVRYYELRGTDDGPFTVHEQASFAPDSENRWMGSAANDHRGNLAVGYSVSSRTTFPAIRYAGRRQDDPPGGLFQTEATLFDGADSQRSNSSRWGDYSALSVDPTDDCTFWYTNEYYEARGAANPATSTAHWLTKVGKFKFSRCQAPRQGKVIVTVRQCATPLPIPGAAITIGGVLYGVTDGLGLLLARLAPRSHRVVASFGGDSAHERVQVRDGRVAVVRLCLE